MPYFPRYAQLTFLAFVVLIVIGPHLKGYECSENIILIGESAFLALISCLLGKRAEGGLIFAVVWGWTWIFSFFEDLAFGCGRFFHDGLFSGILELIPATSFVVYIYVRGIEVFPSFWQYPEGEREEVREEKPSPAEIDRMKPYFPRYAQLTFLALVVLIVVGIYLKIREGYGGREILYFAAGLLILLALCVPGKRAESGLLAVTILEWAIIFKYLEILLWDIYDLQFGLLFDVLVWVPLFIVFVSVFPKSKRYFLFPFDEMMEKKKKQ